MFLVSEHLSVKLGIFIPEKNRDSWQVLSSIFSGRQGIAMTQFDNQPAFQGFAQGFLAFVKRVAKRKNARTIRDFSAERAILQRRIDGSFHGMAKIFAQYRSPLRSFRIIIAQISFHLCEAGAAVKRNVAGQAKRGWGIPISAAGGFSTPKGCHDCSK